MIVTISIESSNWIERPLCHAVLNGRNLESITDQFAILLRRFREAFNGVDVKQVHEYLIDKLQCKIPYHSDIQSFFNYLSYEKLWTYYHISLIESLDKHFLRQSGKSIQQHISDYKRLLSGFFVAKKIINSEFFTDSTSSESTTISVADYTREHHRVLKMRLELKRNVSEESLQYVAELWESLAIEFELPLLTAVIDRIVKKCLEITWLIFPSDAKKIIVATAAGHTDFFEKYAITLLTIDDITIYQKASSYLSLSVHCCGHKFEHDSSNFNDQKSLPASVLSKKRFYREIY